MEIKKFNEYEKIEEGMGFGFGPGMLMCTTTIPVQTGPKVYKTSHILLEINIIKDKIKDMSYTELADWFQTHVNDKIAYHDILETSDGRTFANDPITKEIKTFEKNSK